MPAEGVLQYHVVHEEDVNPREKVAVIVITDGFGARRAEVTLPTRATVALTDAHLNELWARGEVVPMKAYRQAGHRASSRLLDDAADAMYEVIEATATPDMAGVLLAARTLLGGSRKELEWDKLTMMLATANEADRQQFLVLVALIALSRG